MENLKARQKKEAVKRMKKLDIMEQIIEQFEESGRVYLSEIMGFLYWLDKDEQKMVDEFEKKSGCLVYHVIKNETSFGLLYSLLFVSGSDKDWEIERDYLRQGQALAYVVNKDFPKCSDCGSIGIEPSIGGLKRTW